MLTGSRLIRGARYFNGDMGIIREINTFAEQMTIEFDDGKFGVNIPFAQLEELELAYAVTVYIKSQEASIRR